MDYVTLNYGGFGADSLELLNETYGTREFKKLFTTAINDCSSKITFDPQQRWVKIYIAPNNVLVYLFAQGHELPKTPNKRPFAKYIFVDEHNLLPSLNQVCQEIGKNLAPATITQLQTKFEYSGELNDNRTNLKVYCSCQEKSCEHVTYARFLLYIATHKDLSFAQDLLLTPECYTQYIQDLKTQLTDLVNLGFNEFSTEQHNIVKALYLRAVNAKLTSFETLLQALLGTIDTFLNQEEALIPSNILKIVAKIINVIDALESCNVDYTYLEQALNNTKDTDLATFAQLKQQQGALQQRILKLLGINSARKGCFYSLYLIGLGTKTYTIKDPTAGNKTVHKHYMYSPELKRYFYFLSIDSDKFQTSYKIGQTSCSKSSIYFFNFMIENVEYEGNKLKNSNNCYMTRINFNSEADFDLFAYQSFKDYIQQSIRKRADYFTLDHLDLALIKIKNELSEIKSINHNSKDSSYQIVMLKDLNDASLLCVIEGNSYETSEVIKKLNYMANNYIYALVETKFNQGNLVTFLLDFVDHTTLESKIQRIVSLDGIDNFNKLSRKNKSLFVARTIELEQEKALQYYQNLTQDSLPEVEALIK